MIKKTILGLFGIFFLFVLNTNVWAHGASQSFPKEVGNYLVEFEYDSPSIIEGEINSFVFRILNKDTKETIDFDSVLVRFETSDKSTYLVVRLVEDDLLPGLSRLTTILDKGEYTINLSFRKDDEKIAETSYNLSVVRKNTFNFSFEFFVGLVLGIILVTLFVLFKKGISKSVKKNEN